jgi:two-component system NarL family response regulator
MYQFAEKKFTKKKMNSSPADVSLIRVLIADDHPVVRDGLAGVIEEQDDMAVVGQAGTGLDALALHEKQRPDVTLMDLRMPGSNGLGMNGIQTVLAIRKKSPAARAIILSTYDTDEDIYRSLAAGAKAYLLKDVGRQVLLETIRAVHAGHSPVSSEVGAKLANRVSYEELSDRELDVLRLLVVGLSNQEIASSLFITESTVKFHVNHILSKLNVGDRTQAVIIALKRGLASL